MSSFIVGFLGEARVFFFKRALKEGVIVGPRNTVPLQVGFSKSTLPEEWSSTYIPLSQKYPQLKAVKEPQQLSLITHSHRSSRLKFTSPSLTRSMSTLDNSAYKTARKKVVLPPVYLAQPKITPRRSLSSRLDDCQFCVSTPPSSSSASKFQIEKSLEHNGQHQDCQECVKQLLPDIKSFALPRAQSEIVAKVNERHLEPGSSRRTFKNGTLKSDFQWIQMRNLTDPEQSESEKMQNFTNYQIVCMIQNIDDIAKDVLEIKEHIKKLHVGYNEILGVQNKHKQSLNDIQSNMGIISKSLDHLQNAILKSHSPPRYREVDLTSSKFSTASSSNQPQDGIRGLPFKGIENVSIPEFEKSIKEYF